MGSPFDDAGSQQEICSNCTAGVLPIYVVSPSGVMWYYCAVTGESKKIVFTSGATEKITSGVATSDFWSPHK
jgi:hypothetical protein